MGAVMVKGLNLKYQLTHGILFLSGGTLRIKKKIISRGGYLNI
jgi:hypothetical protein